MEIGFENAVHQLKKKLVEKFSSTYETQIIFSLLISNLIFNKVALSNVANAETSPITFFFFSFLYSFCSFCFNFISCGQESKPLSNRFSS